VAVIWELTVSIWDSLLWC